MPSQCAWQRMTWSDNVERHLHTNTEEKKDKLLNTCSIFSSVHTVTGLCYAPSSVSASKVNIFITKVQHKLSILHLCTQTSVQTHKVHFAKLKPIPISTHKHKSQFTRVLQNNEEKQTNKKKAYDSFFQCSYFCIFFLERHIFHVFNSLNLCLTHITTQWQHTLKYLKIKHTHLTHSKKIICIKMFNLFLKSTQMYITDEPSNSAII